MPFVPDEWDIKGVRRPYLWVTESLAPKVGGLYLVALKDWAKPRMAYFRNPGWYCHCTDSELKDITHWAELPPMPKEQYG